MTDSASMLDLALDYASSGWPIFPCRPKDEEVFVPSTGEFVVRHAKSPYTDNGLRAATTNERIIRRWWSDYPDAMIGVPTGRATGVWVLDIDKKPGADGEAELAKLEVENSPLPESVSVRTPSGGRHILFKLPEGMEVRNRGRFANALDVRGEGGYVVAAGSVMANGRTYEWDSRPDEPAEAPQWLLDMVSRRADSMPTLGGHADTANDAYVEAAISSELSDLASTRAGRNSKLNDSAYAIGQFVGAGVLSRIDAEQRLLGAAIANGYVKKDGEHAARATIKSGLDSGQSNPRQIPEREDDGLAEMGAQIASRLLAARAVPHGAAQEKHAYSETHETDEDLALHITPVEWKDPSKLPRRDFVYGTHLIRRYVSVTVAPGGLGKSSLTMVEALAMATGRPLLGVQIMRPLRVWLFNLEDPRDELERRLMAACKHYNISKDDIEGRLFLDSGREQSILVAREHKREGFQIVTPVVHAIKTLVNRHGVDVATIDPFVSTHGVSENDNGAIDKVAKLWSQIADETNCAIELVHHVRKVEGRDITVEDARGAVSLLAAARSVRVLNRMSEDQAASAGVSFDDRFQIFGVSQGKANLAPLSAQSEWRKLESVPLGNGTGPMRPQDHAPVVTEWKWPSADVLVEGVTDEQFDMVKAAIRGGDYYASDQAKKGWAGEAVAYALELPIDDRAVKQKVKRMLDFWLDRGDLVVSKDRDHISKKVRPFIRVA